MRRFPARELAVLAGLASSFGCGGGRGEAQPPADLILRGGKIVTLDPARPEADALAARGGRIVAVGPAAEIERLAGPATEIVELDGHLAIPGFIEGHGHFLGLGKSLLIVDLRGARSWDEVVELAAQAAESAPPDAWIEGRGWHQEKWDTPPEPAVEGYPVHDALSRAVPDHPVVLVHASGHASLVNARAMELASIGPDTPDPAGGEILRDARGRATGLLRENAEDLVEPALAAAEERLSPEAREAHARREIEKASFECLRKGVTSFQDAGSSFETVERLRRAAEAGALGPRLWVMLNEDDAAIERAGAAYPLVGAAGDRLTVRAIKRVLDGALGSHGAWLLQPYTDLPSSVGLNTLPVEALAATARVALDRGLQLCVHAIGDRANREALGVFAAAFGEKRGSTSGGRELRWRIEHAQHLDPADIPRFAELGVIASMQAVHCTSDGPWVPERLGASRAESGAYMWRALLDSGAVVTNGTDTPVEDVDPIANFHAAVTRRMHDGNAFYPAQRMTREEALSAQTLAAAYAAFEEDVKGSLAPGKLADVVVLSRDILTVADEEIPGTEVVVTIVGGKVAYRQGETSHGGSR